MRIGREMKFRFRAYLHFLMLTPSPSVNMKRKEMHIYLNGVRIFAHHGVLPQEKAVGAYFIIDLDIETDFSLAAENDDLNETLNYAEIYATLKEVMKTPSKLLEHVCERIANSLFLQFSAISELSIRLTKENPPMGAECKEVGVAVHYTR